jgi:hypothetical protein
VLPDADALTLEASGAICKFRTAWPPGKKNSDGAQVSRFLKLLIRQTNSARLRENRESAVTDLELVHLTITSAKLSEADRYQ